MELDALRLVLLGGAGWTLSAIIGAARGEVAGLASVGVALLGSLFGVIGAIAVLGGADTAPLLVPFAGQSAAIGLDPLSAAFLLPVFMVGACAAVYGLSYWPDARHPASARQLRCFLALLVVGMIGVLLARHGLLFLVLWELMALSAYFLITIDDRVRSVRRAGWVYFIATHIGTAALIAMVVLLSLRGGGLAWHQVGGHAPLDVAILALALIGFGLKAGIFPLHFWLPGAHASAPSHVSAILSAVMLKTGVYGILRISGYLAPAPLWLGTILGGIACTTILYGILNALSQSDYKRLLAYSSIENIGIIVLGIAMAWVGRALAQPALVAFGLGAALLHTWNHAAFKSLLFLGAGSVLHATGTRRMDDLGGLARAMPATAVLMAIGAVAVAGLPLGNGFVGEWLLYRGLFASLAIPRATALSVAIPVLALTGGLAAATFLKMYGTIFLGRARKELRHPLHEADAVMLGPMLGLAGACALGVILPFLLLPVLDRVISSWSGGMAGSLAVVAGTDTRILCAVSICGIGIAALLAWSLAGCMRAAGSSAGSTWGCGYAEPTPRMQYTARSFGAWLGDLIPGMRPRIQYHRPDGLFPSAGQFSARMVDPVGDRVYGRGIRWLRQRLLRWSWLQQGHLQLYLLYVFIAMIAALGWGVLRPMVER